jgi:Flp pilus assembly protein CpaB
LRQAIILDVILIVIVGIFFVASLLKPSLPMLPCEEDADVNEAPTNDVIVQSGPL